LDEPSQHMTSIAQMNGPCHAGGAASRMGIPYRDSSRALFRAQDRHIGHAPGRLSASTMGRAAVLRSGTVRAADCVPVVDTERLRAGVMRGTLYRQSGARVVDTSGVRIGAASTSPTGRLAAWSFPTAGGDRRRTSACSGRSASSFPTPNVTPGGWHRT
jgi:hypothetical protein